MTSVLPEEESAVTRLKQMTQSHVTRGPTKPCRGHEEARTFLDLSRENLSISHSELEQGFRKPWRPGARCCARQTLLSCAAILLALGCAGLELWKLRRVLANGRDIETLRRDVEQLKHRFLEKDLLEELRSFEEQLYGEGTNEDSEDLSSNDYDSGSYDESSGPSSSGDHRVVTYAPGRGSSAGASLTSARRLADGSTSTEAPCAGKELEDVRAMLRREEAERVLEEEHRKFFTRVKHPTTK